jgi:hypothetical protein
LTIQRNGSKTAFLKAIFMSAPRHFIDLNDIPGETLKGILKNAHELKKRKCRRRSFLPGFRWP